MTGNAVGPGGTPTARRPQRHLMDPNNPRQPQRRDPMSLNQVQRWVMSILAVTTIAHLAVGLVFAAANVEESRTDARIGLIVIAGAFGVLGIAAGLAIHQQRLVSPWLVLGLIPALVGAYLLF